MHFSYWMVLIAALMPVLTVAGAKSTKGYDNSNPRVALDQLSGWRKRADWAHRNHFEAFPPFAAAVIIAQLKGTSQGSIDLLAGVFVFARVLYSLAYIADQASLRSVIWGVGFICTIALFVM